MAAQVLRPRRCPATRLQPPPPPPSPAKGCRGSGGGSSSSARPCSRTSLPSPSAPSRGNQKNGRRNRSAASRSGRRPESRRSVAAKSPGKELVAEEVASLKLKEAVREPPAEVLDGDSASCSTDGLGPDPETLPKQTRLVGGDPSLQADLGFLASPSPSSLPFPASFFAKKDACNGMDLATKGIRCLLRL